MSTWVLLRGLTRESRHWGGFPAHLCSGIPGANVVMPDLPGNGRLHRLKSPISIEAMAEHCRADLLAQRVPPPYRLLAMSLGAMVAVAWAHRYPDEVQGCVLINTSLRTLSPFYERLRPRNYPALLKLAVFGGPVDRERNILRLTSRHGDGSADILAAWIAFRREHPVSRTNALRQLLAAMRYRAPADKPAIPVLVLASDNDALVNPRCSQRLARHWQVPLAMHPSAGHDIPLDDPAWVASEVRRWLGAI